MAQQTEISAEKGRKPVKIEFVGGYIKFTPAGTIQSKDGSPAIDYDPSVKISSSASKGAEVPVSASAVKAIVKIFERHEQAKKFLEDLPKNMTVDEIEDPGHY